MGTIDIDINLVPYSFEVELSNKIYTFVINYNFANDYFTVDLLFNNIPLVQGEKLVLNEILFRDIYEDKEHNVNEEFPSELLMPVSSNNDVKRISIDNLGTDVQLYYFERSELKYE